MVDRAAIAKRRQAVGELWLRGVPVLKIAGMLDTPHRTIRDDVAKIQEQLRADRIAELDARRDRSVAVLRKVEQEAWTLFHRLNDAASSSRVGALNTVRTTEELIAKMEGTLGPDIAITTNTLVNTLSADEWQRIQQTIAEALLPYTEARIAVAAALARMGESGAPPS